MRKYPTFRYVLKNQIESANKRKKARELSSGLCLKITISPRITTAGIAWISPSLIIPSPKANSNKKRQ